MSKRMYYSEAEAAEKLKVGAEALAAMVQDQKLRVYMDGSKKMYRAEEVDALVPPSPEIELSPADTSADSISLSELESPTPAKTKEDTVITAEGISIFDHEDLEVESADPMAKTQIAPSVEDQASIDGTGSGSGLLDLTRESDETSLGAEVLDHIDIEGAVGSGLESEIPEPAAPTPAQEVVVVEQAPDSLDADSGLYNGFVIGSTLVMLVLATVVIAAMNNVMPDFVKGMKDNMVIVLAVFVVVAGITAAVGYMMGKAVARQSATKNETGQGTAG